MKFSNLLLITAFGVIVSFCTPKKEYQSFGEMITDKEAKSTDILMSLDQSDTTSIKLTATVDQVCQAKGCWMTLKNEGDAPIRVTFKDYGFFVPKDISGNEVIVEGELIKSELSVDMARHYAEDAGEPYDSTKSYVEYALIASGVLVAQQ